MNDKTAVIVDLDGTLCNTTHRQHFLDKNPPDWESFNLHCSYDTPNVFVREVVFDHFLQNRRVHIFTGREGTSLVHARTVEWLKKHKVPFDGLWMREEGDYCPAPELKDKLLNEFYKRCPRQRILCVYEDDPKAIAMFRERGITCMEVRPV